MCSGTLAVLAHVVYPVLKLGGAAVSVWGTAALVQHETKYRRSVGLDYALRRAGAVPA